MKPISEQITSYKSTRDQKFQEMQGLMTKAAEAGLKWGRAEKMAFVEVTPAAQKAFDDFYIATTAREAHRLDAYGVNGEAMLAEAQQQAAEQAAEHFDRRVVAPYRELRSSLSDLRLNDLAVGPDGRNRTILSAFRSRTGRGERNWNWFGWMAAPRNIVCRCG